MPAVSSGTAAVSSLWVPAGGSGVPASELNALADLYFATGGNTSWIWTAGWSTLDEGGTPSDPCDDAWFGVTCAAGGKEKTHVVGLDLSLGQLGDLGNGLDGSLPESIGNLTRVKVRLLLGMLRATWPSVPNQRSIPSWPHHLA